MHNDNDNPASPKTQTALIQYALYTGRLIETLYTVFQKKFTPMTFVLTMRNENQFK